MHYEAEKFSVDQTGGSVRISAHNVAGRCGQLLQRLYSEDHERGGYRRLLTAQPLDIRT